MSGYFYFVAAEDVPVSFRENSIPTLRYKLGGQSGFIFPLDRKDQVARLLGWEAERVLELPTSEWSIDWLTPGDERAIAGVSIECHDPPSSAWQTYLDEVATWCRNRTFTAPVVVHYAYGSHGIYPNGKTHLCFGGKAKFKFRTWAFERDIVYQRSHFWLGELGPEHQACRDLMPKVLDKFMPRVASGGYVDGQDALVSYFTYDLVSRQNRTQKEWQAAKEEVERLQQSLVAAIRREEENRRNLIKLQELEGKRTEELQQALDRLAKRDYTTAVWYEDGALYLLTERKLAVVNNGKPDEDGTYDLGEYLIVLYLDGSHGGVRMFNQTRTGPVKLFRRFVSTGLCQHPHIAGDGAPCLGTVQETIPRYIAQGEWEAAFDLLSRYLETIDTADTWGRTVVKWPKFDT